MPRPLLPTLAAALGLAPALALACPADFEDSAAGLIVRYEDGVTAHLTRDSDGMVTEEVRFAPDSGDGYRVLALHGLFMVEDVDIEDGAELADSMERQSFPGGVGALPEPEPGLVWSGEVTVAVGGEDSTRQVFLGLGSRSEITFGGCEYESWSATLRYSDDAGEEVLGYDYLPALGIALIRSSTDMDGAADLYTPLSISRADAD